jgi:hypothetical protein
MNKRFLLSADEIAPIAPGLGGCPLVPLFRGGAFAKDNLRRGWSKQHEIGIIPLTDDSFDLVHNLPAHNRLKNVHLECKNSYVRDCFFHAKGSLFIERTAPPYPESLGAWEQSPDAKLHGFLDSWLLPLRRRAHASS